MPGADYHWPMLLMVALLTFAIIGMVFVVRYFIRPVDMSKPDSGKSVIDSNPPPVDSVERDTYIVIPDISGYTRFMQLTRFAAGHAHFVVAQILDEIITAALPVLTPTRVEGDSVMFYAEAEGGDQAADASGADIAAAVRKMVEAFYRKRDELLASNLCPCEACSHIPNLDLKVVVHRGDVLRYRLRGLEDLSGMAVIEAHRLLKNSLGRDRYVLVSDAAAEQVRLHWKLESNRHRESYEGVGEVHCDLYLLEEEIVTQGEIEKSPLHDMTGKLVSNLQTMVGQP